MFHTNIVLRFEHIILYNILYVNLAYANFSTTHKIWVTTKT